MVDIKADSKSLQHFHMFPAACSPLVSPSKATSSSVKVRPAHFCLSVGVTAVSRALISCGLHCFKDQAAAVGAAAAAATDSGQRFFSSDSNCFLTNSAASAAPVSNQKLCRFNVVVHFKCAEKDLWFYIFVKDFVHFCKRCKTFMFYNQKELGLNPAACSDVIPILTSRSDDPV